MKIITYRTILIIGLATILVSCNSFQKLLKSNDINAKYTKAKELFNDKQFHKSVMLIEDIIPYYKTSKEYEKVNYLYAYCQMALGNNLLASHRFKMLYDTYPFGEYAEEALFNFAYCLYLESPPVELDQSYSKKGIEAIQLFINKYPDSDKVEKCNEYMDGLFTKLEKKAVHMAKLYYKIEEYKAAIWSLSKLIEEYPMIEEKNELQFLILEAHFKLAQRSIESKKKQRINDTIEYYKTYEDIFSSTKYAAQAESIYKNALDQMKKNN